MDTGGPDVEIPHSVLGVLGNVASCLFFLSSAPTVVRIVKLKSCCGLSGDLYVFKLFNCLLWAFYGLPFVHPHDFWVVLTNVFGCVFSILYIVVYLFYASKAERVSVLWKLFAIIGGFVTMVVLLLCVEHSQRNRILIVGVLCVLISSAMHITLLSQCRIAMQTRDIGYLQPNSSVAAFIKGAIWTCYGIVNLDVFIVIPNGVGILIGVIQVIMVLVVGIRRTELAAMQKTELEKCPPTTQTATLDNISATVRTISVTAGHSKVCDTTSNDNLTDGEGTQATSRVSSWLGVSRRSSVSTVVPMNEDEHSHVSPPSLAQT